MEAKKNSRMTIKSVKEELKKEIDDMKEWVKTLENRLNISETKVKHLEDKLSKKNNGSENHNEQDSRIEIKCKICDIMYTSKKNLKLHMRESHPKSFNCIICAESFEKSSDMELHLKENHSSPEFTCDQCDKSFVLKWRLKKHLEIHMKSSAKSCHYFNNGKNCPYENVGCMFLHKDSENCYFGVQCKNKLCQFKHPEHKNNVAEDDYEVVLEDQFKKLTYEEQMETKDVFCDIYCNRGFDCHICSQDGYQEYIGCDMKNITEEFVDENDELPVTYYPCSKCDDRFDENEQLNKHFSEHHTPEELVKCAFRECEFSTKTISVLVMHIGVNHLDYVRRKL